MIKYYIVGIIIGFIPGFLLSEIICKSKKEDDVKAIFVGCMQKNEEMICNWHIDDRYSDERGKHPNKFRIVAACWKCNFDRAKARELSLPREVLWERSQRQGRDKRIDLLRKRMS